MPKKNTPITAGPDGLPRLWEIEFFETEDGRKPVFEWIKKDLTPTKRRALGTAMRRVLQTQGPEVVESRWGRWVAKDIFEFRLSINGKSVVNLEAEINEIDEEEARRRFSLNPSEDILIRVFCACRDNRIILLLHAYDKGKNPSKKRQQSMIREAERRLKSLKTNARRRNRVKRG